VVLALAWPYYSMARLLGAEARATYATNRFMYPGLNSAFAQLYAAALGVPLLLARWRRNRRDALVVAFAGLAVVYGWGAWSERWSYGRVLSSMVLVLQLAIADWVVRTLGGLGERATRVRSLLLLGPLAALLVAMAFELAPTVERFAKGRDVVPAYERYGFLGEHVDEGAVVMSRASLRDDAASYVVAAFGGRVVAAPVLMFVADADTRLADVRRFFQPQTPQAVRRELLAKYDARYLLVQGSADDPAMRWAWDLGSVLYNQADVFLFDVRGGA
jgi:alpha-1,6-mannosyltransferase